MTDLSIAGHIGAALPDGAVDVDPAETAEWCEALDALIAAHGESRARFLFDALLAHARRHGVRWLPSMVTPYVNSIPLASQTPFPGDLAMEQRLAALMRWNALAMVMRANRVESGGSAELGGHIASYASAADLFEVGFNHFFRARSADDSALVLGCELGGVRVLLLGSLGRNGQRRLLGRSQPGADVVVVGIPNEGEPLGEPLGEAIGPRVIVLSSGEYPASRRVKAVTRERLAASGRSIVYTRDSGAVTLRFHDQGVELSALDGKRLQLGPTSRP